MLIKRQTGSVKRGVVATDLLEERQKCAFDQHELRTVLSGGEFRQQKWKEMVDIMGSDPELRNNIEFYELDPHEQQVNLWKRLNVLYKKHNQSFFIDNIIMPPNVNWCDYFQGLFPGIGMHVTMFRMSVENLCDAEQKAKWLPQIQNVNILGCYAQTEIGHGSNVAGIETTATLDKATDEFVIHTPSITATKYWPGDMGRFSSHAIVFARLIIDKQDNGVQAFMV